MADDKKLIFKTALIYFQEGRWEKAIAEFKRLVALDPEDLGTRNMLGDAYMKKGAMKEAYEEYSYAAEGYSKKGESEKANAIYKKMSKVELSNLDVAQQKKLRIVNLMVRGDGAFEQGNYEDAAQSYQEVANIEPQNVEVVAKLAEIYARMGRNKEASANYLTVGKYYLENRLFKRALLLFQRVVELDPSNVDARLSLGDLLSREGQELEARREFETVAEYFISQDQLDKAQQCCQKAIQLKSINAHYIIGEIFIRRKMFDEARAELETFLKIKANHVPAQYGLGFALMNQGKLDEAMATFGRILGRQPDHVESLERMAEIYAKKNATGDAIIQYLNLAQVFSGQKIVDRAEGAIRKALEMDAENMDGHRRLAELFEMRGMRKEAAQEFMAALKCAQAQGLAADATAIGEKVRVLDPSLLGGAAAPAPVAPAPAAPAPVAQAPAAQAPAAQAPVPPAAVPTAVPPPVAPPVVVRPVAAPPPVIIPTIGAPPPPAIGAGTPPSAGVAKVAPLPVVPPPPLRVPGPIIVPAPAVIVPPVAAARPKTALSSEQRIKRFLSMGQAAIRQGLVDEAMDCYQQAQQLAPNDAEIKTAIQGMMRDYVKGAGGAKKTATAGAVVAPASPPPAGSPVPAPVVSASSPVPLTPAPAPSAPAAETAEDMERRIREKVMTELGQKAGVPSSAGLSMGEDERRRLVEETKSQVLAAASPAAASATPARPTSGGAIPQPGQSPEETDTETMAQIFMKQGHWADALKAFESVLRRDPSRADVAQMVMDLRARVAPIRPEPPPPSPPPRDPEPAEPVAAAAPRARLKPRVSYV